MNDKICEFVDTLKLDVAIQTSMHKCKRRYTLRAKCEYRYKGQIIVVPKGFASDGGSIPRICWRIMHPTEFIYSFVIHDYLYAENFNGDKVLCDKMFKDFLIEEGCGSKRAYLAYLGVRMHGRKGWEGNV